ncbi:MAG: sigma-70 family RNA polymerase sigma factor [Lachnospiraceae bacterium]|nr:sigma-70 family RNA polymerase sigma factor [Lachnospiraceae bacterium]
MENLIKRAQNRDAEAFTALMRRQMQSMYKTSRAILTNEEDAADAVSETILTCWEKLSQLENPSYFRTWMTRILINKCNDILRRKEKLFFTEEMPEIPSQDTGYLNAEWNEALKSLDEKYRLVIMLYYVEGYKTSEISAILEIPESTVRTRLARGRQRLALEYGREQTVPEDGQTAGNMRETAAEGKGSVEDIWRTTPKGGQTAGNMRETAADKKEASILGNNRIRIERRRLV